MTEFPGQQFRKLRSSLGQNELLHKRRGPAINF